MSDSPKGGGIKATRAWLDKRDILSCFLNGRLTPFWAWRKDTFLLQFLMMDRNSGAYERQNRTRGKFSILGFHSSFISVRFICCLFSAPAAGISDWEDLLNDIQVNRKGRPIEKSELVADLHI
jgi:hypothetical protein